MNREQDTSLTTKAAHKDADAPDAYVLRLPLKNRAPVVFAVPHSGRFYPESFHRASKLSPQDLRLSEDAFVDDLFEPVSQMGAAMLVATHARAYVDLNRSVDELDPSMFKDGLGDTPVDINNRVSAGLGVIPRIIGENMPIYENKLAAREAFKRLDAVYKPYHAKLADLLMSQIKTYGTSILFDCHSMPSGPELHRRGQPQPDIILGDCWGTSCNRELTSLAEKLFFEAGFNVRRNIPYAGGYATRHYGNPKNNCNALQIEINRSIYMDEKRVEKQPHFNEVRTRITTVASALIDATEPQAKNPPLAAE
ncbi:N-formylglutamate amidohydrolase [Kordiimonas aquimaris]|uniref:N-formylglutamate amidohydrolase n=1 Tax=Kordiimonas aquimaris TaxID=707591 RepID=UPI0021D045C8|nr:N-formylglutamate amidohydrolase [Kordiimonas aquimaris]